MNIEELENNLKGLNNQLEFSENAFNDQELLEMMNRVTGSSSFLYHTKLLINIIVCKLLQGKVSSDTDSELESAKERIKELERMIDCFDKLTKQQLKVMTGNKIAYREDVTRDRIISLKNQGKSVDEICNILHISRATIWRRLK